MFTAGSSGSAAQGAPITQIKTGVLTALQEDQTRYYAMAVLSNDPLTVATISWAKEPLQSWLAKRPNKVSTSMAPTTSHYALPSTQDGGGCIDDSWTAISGSPDGRAGHTAVWTGSEMLIWGGSLSSYLNSGGKYDPTTDTWTAMNATSAPMARTGHTAV